MYARITYPKFQFFDDNGQFGIGYLVYTLKAGTVDTLATTYQDRSLAVGTENTNPIVLDARGECDIYTDADIAIGVALPGGDLSSIFLFVDYASEPSQTEIVQGTVVPTTSDNLYNVTSVPPQTALSNQMLIFTPDVDSESTTSTKTFTGTGENDCTFSGAYTGTTSGSIFEVQIVSAGSPDTVKWRKDSGAFTTVPITGAAQTMIEGLSFKFARTTGHNAGPPP